MKISIIITSIKIVPELMPLISEILAQARTHPEINCRVALVTYYNPVLQKELQNRLKENYKNIVHINTDKDIGYFGKFNLALERDEVINSDLFVFMSDDIIIKSNFLDILKQINLNHSILYAPLVYIPNEQIQFSVFRKSFSKFSTFIRYYNGGVYTKIVKPLHVLDVNIKNINKERFTVNGCCFIMNRPALIQMGRFDANIYLYHEEVFLFAMVRKFRWDCRVLVGLPIVHTGARSAPKFTPLHARIDRESAIYTAKQYLGFNSIQLFAFRIFKWLEFCVRSLIAFSKKN